MEGLLLEIATRYAKSTATRRALQSARTAHAPLPDDDENPFFIVLKVTSNGIDCGRTLLLKDAVDAALHHRITTAHSAALLALCKRLRREPEQLADSLTLRALGRFRDCAARSGDLSLAFDHAIDAERWQKMRLCADGCGELLMPDVPKGTKYSPICSRIVKKVRELTRNRERSRADDQARRRGLAKELKIRSYFATLRIPLPSRIGLKPPTLYGRTTWVTEHLIQDRPLRERVRIAASRAYDKHPQDSAVVAAFDKLSSFIEHAEVARQN